MRKNYICPSVNNEDLVSDCDLFDEILGLYKHERVAALLRTFETEDQYNESIDGINDI